MKNRLGEILVEKGVLTQEQLSSLLGLQNETGRRLGDLIVEQGMALDRKLLFYI